LAGIVLKVPCKAHCFNSMNPDFTEMGRAYAVNPRGDAPICWTQEFGTRR
jgi:uncharacterized protein YkwD